MEPALEDTVRDARRTAAGVANTLSQMDELLLSYGYGEEEMYGLASRAGEVTRGPGASAAGPLLSPAVLYATISHSSSALCALVQEVRSLAERARNMGLVPGGHTLVAAGTAQGVPAAAEEMPPAADDSDKEEDGFVVLGKTAATEAGDSKAGGNNASTTASRAPQLAGAHTDVVTSVLQQLDAWSVQYAAAAKALSQPGSMSILESAEGASLGVASMGTPDGGTPTAGRRYGMQDAGGHAGQLGAVSPLTPMSKGVPGAGG